MVARPSDSEAMSNVDCAWLHMDEPANLMMVVGVLVLDRPVDYERLREVVAARLLRFPRFRQRVVAGALPLQGSRWEVDPAFDLDHHLRRESLADPCDERALQDLVSRLMSEPFDPERPLWQYHVVEGYRGGTAVVCRLHHCIADGIALVHVMMSLTDDRPDAPVDRPIDAGPAGDDEEWTLEKAGRRVGRALGRAVNVASEYLAHPAKVAEAVGVGARGTTALGRLALLEPDPATPLKGELSGVKRAVWSRPLPLEDVKRIGRSTGSTVNDVLLAAASGALGRYLRHRGLDPTGIDIRAVVPVNLRAPEHAHELGNRFGLVFASLPIGIEEPLERIFEVRSRMTALKDSPEAVVAFGILQSIGMAPKQIFDLVVKIFGMKATAVMTNVPGPRAPVYFAGAKLEQGMFWVPRSAGLALGVSLLSYDGRVWLGIATDAGVIPDPEVVLDGFYEEFDAMGALARVPQ